MNLSNSWQTVRMKEVCDITSSKRIYAADYRTEGIPFYRGKEIIEKQKGLLDISTELYISEEKYNAIKSKFGVLQSGDLLLTSVGTLGIPYVIKQKEEFYFKDGNLTWFRNFRNLGSRYLYYWLLSAQGRAQLKKCTIGSSQPALTIVLLKDMDIELPPLPTQKRIATILSAYDDLVGNNNRRIKILEGMAKLIYQEWFVNFRFPGHDNVKMVNSPLGKIPEGWEIRSIGEAVETWGGGTPSTKVQEYWLDGEIQWFTPSDLTKTKSMFIHNSGGKITHTGLNKCAARIFPAFSVMMTSRATIGVTSINVSEACTNQGFITSIPNERISALNIYFWIQENLEQIISIASGATYKEINRTEFRSLPIIVPHVEIARTFAELTSPFSKQIVNLLAKNQNLRQTRDLLLPKLIFGEVDVSELDIDIGEEKP